MPDILDEKFAVFDQHDQYINIGLFDSFEEAETAAAEHGVSTDHIDFYVCRAGFASDSDSYTIYPYPENDHE